MIITIIKASYLNFLTTHSGIMHKQNYIRYSDSFNYTNAINIDKIHRILGDMTHW